MEYPILHTIDNPKLKSLLTKKTDLVLEGREVSMQIEEKEIEMDKVDKAIQEEEKKANIKELDPIVEDITNRMNKLMEEMEAVKKEIYKRCKEVVPANMVLDYEQLKIDKEKLEKDRNKIGLKIQKIKDQLIPLTQKEAKSLLQDEFEDFGDVRIENGEVVIEVFSHLENWKKERAKKLKEKYLQN